MPSNNIIVFETHLKYGNYLGMHLQNEEVWQMLGLICTAGTSGGASYQPVFGLTDILLIIYDPVYEADGKLF